MQERLERKLCSNITSNNPPARCSLHLPFANTKPHHHPHEFRCQTADGHFPPLERKPQAAGNGHREPILVFFQVGRPRVVSGELRERMGSKTLDPLARDRFSHHERSLFTGFELKHVRVTSKKGAPGRRLACHKFLVSLAPGTENTGFVVSFVRVLFLILLSSRCISCLQHVHFQNMKTVMSIQDTLQQHYQKSWSPY